MKNLAVVLLTAFLSVAAFDSFAMSDAKKGATRSEMKEKVTSKVKKMKKARKAKKARRQVKNKIKKNKAKRQQKSNS